MATMSESNITYSNHALPNICTYFYHVINVETGSLTVQVLGPNLTHTFEHVGETDLNARLVRKTTGFIALISPNSARIILSWAESGYVGPPNNTLLHDTDSATLPNSIWCARAVKLAKLVHMNTNSLYDGALRLPNRQLQDGVFFGAHVEVKLSTFAVLGLLRTFRVLDNLEAVRWEHLVLLRNVRWEDGSRPCFEIHFSRAPCPRCRQFVRRLQRVTGIQITLRWHQRLVNIQYDQADDGERNPQDRDDARSVIDDPEEIANAVPEETAEADIADLMVPARRERQAGDALDLSDVEKPLPATPEKCPPEWLLNLSSSLPQRY